MYTLPVLSSFLQVLPKVVIKSSHSQGLRTLCAAMRHMPRDALCNMPAAGAVSKFTAVCHSWGSCRRLREHPFIVTVRDVFLTHHYLVQTMDLGETDLGSIIGYHSSGIGMRLAMLYFRQIIVALKYCHDRLVVVRDLKPGNVLRLPQRAGDRFRHRISLCDFGWALSIRDLVRTTSTHCTVLMAR
jgi:serine/threonine protein kinase